MPYGRYEQIAPKAAAIWRNLCHIWRDCSKELNWILILNNRPYEAWIIRIGLLRYVFFFLLFCFALVTCALIAVALQRFKSNWQSATDGHMSQHAANILSIMLFHYIIRCTSEDHILTKCNWWTRVSQHGGNIYSMILWFGIFPHCNI